MNTRRMAAAFRKFSSCAVLVGLGVVGWTGLARAQNTLTAGQVSGQGGQAAAVPITIKLASGTSMDFFGLTFTVVAQGGAPAITDKLTYSSTVQPAPDTVVPDQAHHSLAIGYVSMTISPAVTGTQQLGTLMVPIPAGATSGSYQVQLSNFAGGLSSDPNVMIDATAENGTITIGGGGEDTPTATATASPSATPTLTAGTAGNTLTAGQVSGQGGQAAAVPITINLTSGTTMDFFGLTFTVVAQGGAPAITDKLTYSSTVQPAPDTVVPDQAHASLAIGYVSMTISPPVTGTQQLGMLMVPIPTGATSGSYQVQLSNFAGGLSSDPNVMIDATLQNGTITIGGLNPTPTNTPTNSPAATPTNTSGGTATTTPTATRAPIITPTTPPVHVANLAADINATQTPIPVDDITNFPDSGKIMIDQEIIRYNGTQSGTGTGGGGGASTAGLLLNAIRGADDTTPAAHTKGTAVLLFQPPTPSGNLQDSDGCSIGTNGSTGRGWLLVIPAVGLLLMRRRKR